MKTILKSLTCFLILCFALPAFAGSIKEYSADMVDVKSGKVAQKLAVTPDKIYSESFNAQGKREAMSIIRMDKKKMYVVMEENKSYMELPFNKDEFSAADFSIGAVQTKQEKVGTETVGGYKADKFKVTTTAMGRTITSFQWIAPEFAPMPIRTESDGAILEMQNIKTACPDASLFELPKGYTRDTQMEQMMNSMMGGGSNPMEDMMKMMMQQQGGK